MEEQNVKIDNLPTVSFTSYSTNNELIEKSSELQPENQIMDILNLASNNIFEDKKYSINENREIIINAYQKGLWIKILQNRLEEYNITNIEISLIIKNSGEIYYVVDSYIENGVEQKPNEIYYSMDGKLTPRSDILMKTLGNKIEINKLKTNFDNELKINILSKMKIKKALSISEKEGNYSLAIGYKNLKNVVEQKFGIIDKVEEN